MDVVRYLAGEKRSRERDAPLQEPRLPGEESFPDSSGADGIGDFPEKPGKSQTEQPSMLRVPLKDILPNPRQPRKHFDEESLRELADSICSVGLLQPLAVRPREEGYELISGERRLRACKLAGMETVPVMVFRADDREQHLMALVQNIQRQDLSPVEEAASLAEILEETGESQSALAERLGRSQASVANKLRLLRLEEEVRDLIQQRLLGERQARALVGLERDAQILLAREAVEGRIPAKDMERRARETKKASGIQRKKKDSSETKASSRGSIDGPDGPTGDLLQELVALVERRKSQGLPVVLKVRELQQSQLVVEVQVNLGNWNKTEKTKKEEPTEEVPSS